MSMGRSKGIVEIHFNDSEAKELAKRIIDAMPAEHKGAVNVDGSKLFGGFATGISALFQYHGSWFLIPQSVLIVMCKAFG